MRWGDLGQLIFLVVFLIVWSADCFFLNLSTQFMAYAAFVIRLPLAMIVFVIGGYLAKQGLTIVFAEVREEPIVIRKGVFAIVRHPIYLGAILFYLALLILYFSMAAAFVWVLIILFYVYLCKHEEKLLRQKFGGDYEQYQLETPMLIPRLNRGIKER